MVSVEQLGVSFGGFDLLKDISFQVNPRDRIGLVGKNGAGKSTMLKIISGLQKPTSGIITLPDGVTVGYLPQQMVHRDGRTVVEETRLAFEEVLALDKEIKRINEQLQTRTDYESDAYSKLIHRLTDAGERFHMLGGDSIDADIEQTLTGLGFSTSDFNRSTREFSGGWRMRIELAKLLLRRPGVFLLDEPTNHLDIESIQWLEVFLKDYPGAAIVISHDRAFLDNVTNRTIEISLGRIYDYKVSYSRYVVLHQERRDQQMAAFRNQQKMIEDTEDFIERFRYKASKAVQVQSRIKQLEKVDRIEIDEEDKAAMHIKFPPAPRSGTIVVEAENMSKAYGDKLVLDKLDFILERGEKVAFVGKNGEGKTTFSRVIIGELEHKGKLKLGHNVKIGYFAQNQDELFDENLTVLETIDRVAVGDVRLKMRDLLGAFLFRGEDVDKKVKVLSGGERSRLAMVKLLLEPFNLLVLDEPTNHLDMRSKDLLKQALVKYDGTLIVVSHDREFLNGLVQKVYEFKNHKTREFIGGIYEFLEKKKIDNLNELERAKKAEAKVEKEAPVSKMDYQERKEFDRELRKAKNLVEQHEKRVGELEGQIAKLNDLMASDEAASDQAANQKWYEDHARLSKELESEMSNWEKAMEVHDKLMNERD